MTEISLYYFLPVLKVSDLLFQLLCCDLNNNFF